MDEQVPKTNGRKKTSAASACDLGGCCGGSCGGACGCGGSMWKCHHSCPLIRWILGLIIIAFVFWCGMKIGELKSELGAGDGFGRQGYYSRYQMMSGGPGRMMIWDAGTAADQTPATKTSTTSKK